MNSCKDYKLFLTLGVILQIACTIALSISSVNKYNFPIEMLFREFLLPNVLSCFFIVIGLVLFIKSCRKDR
jgi:uncharacterized membrane protein YidH (DUF202 family)